MSTRSVAFQGSIKITLYSNEGPRPDIMSISPSLEDAALLEWAAIVGTAEHLLRNHQQRLPASRRALLEAFLTASKGAPDAPV